MTGATPAPPTFGSTAPRPKKSLDRRPARAAVAQGRAAGIRRRLVVGRTHLDPVRAASPYGGARLAVVPRHRRRVCRGTFAGTILRPIYPRGAAGRHGRGLRHRAISRAHRRQSEEPRRAHGDGPEALHRGDGALAQAVLAGANFTIMGVADDQLRLIKAPTIVIPGNDNTTIRRAAAPRKSSSPAASCISCHRIRTCR